MILLTFDEFIVKYNGQTIDFDGHFGPQCVDLIRQYIHEVLGTQQPYSVVGAYQLLDELPVGYEIHLSGEIKKGDILVWQKGYGENGHTSIALDSNAQQVQVFEQNNPIGSKCHTAWHNYGYIRGWFRPVTTLQKTFMSATVADNAHWPTLQAQLDTLKAWFLHYSNNRFEPVFDTKQTNFGTVPFSIMDGSSAPDVNWYRINVTPLTKGQATFLLLPMNQWQENPNSPNWIGGKMTWGDPGKPVRIQCTGNENEIIPSNTPGGYDAAPVFVHRAFHEICHALFFLTGQPDRVHEFLLNVPDDRRAALLDLVDWRALQSALVKIKG